MKKFFVMLLSTIIIVMSFCITSAAVDMEDGIYEVPVTLMHKEDEKESFGNKYIAPIGLLEIVDNRMTITILLTTNMDGIEFSYYTNGSLEGETKDCKAVSDVTVAGTVYEQGFEIPIAKSGDIGLMFSVPVMPMSPSARLRIDYSSATLIFSDETKTESQITEEETSLSHTETVKIEEVESSTEAETTSPENEFASEIIDETTSAENTIVDDKTTENSEDGNRTSAVVYAVILVGIVIIILLIAKRIKEKNNNDDK